MDTITQMALGDIMLCLVRAAAAIIRRIRDYPGTTVDTPISAIMINDRITHVMSQDIINALQDVVVAIGEHQLGINKEDIGTHSIKSGAAMAMYLGECAIYVGYHTRKITLPVMPLTVPVTLSIPVMSAAHIGTVRPFILSFF